MNIFQSHILQFKINPFFEKYLSINKNGYIFFSFIKMGKKWNFPFLEIFHSVQKYEYLINISSFKQLSIKIN